MTIEIFPEVTKEEHEFAVTFLADFRNHLMLGKFGDRPEDRSDQAAMEEYWAHSSRFGRYRTIEEAYTRSGYHSLILPRLLRGAPEQVAKINDFVRQLNEALNARDLESLERLEEETKDYIRSECLKLRGEQN